MYDNLVYPESIKQKQMDFCTVIGFLKKKVMTAKGLTSCVLTQCILGNTLANGISYMNKETTTVACLSGVFCRLLPQTQCLVGNIRTPSEPSHYRNARPRSSMAMQRKEKLDPVAQNNCKQLREAAGTQCSSHGLEVLFRFKAASFCASRSQNFDLRW